MTFSRTVAERKRAGQRQDVEDNSISLLQNVSDLDYLCHVYARTEGLAGASITDKDLPPRVAFFKTNVVDEFMQRYPPSKFKPKTLWIS